MKPSVETDFSKSLDELHGVDSGPAKGAPTRLVRSVVLSRKKPLNALRLDEIGRLVLQLDGFPYLLDLVFPLLEADPLVDGGYYPGDMLSQLLQAEQSIWNDRPAYQERLADLYQRALDRPADENDAFLDSLGLGGDPSLN
jgi:hypothetical protein